MLTAATAALARRSGAARSATARIASGRSRRRLLSDNGCGVRSVQASARLLESLQSHHVSPADSGPASSSPDDSGNSATRHGGGGRRLGGFGTPDNSTGRISKVIGHEKDEYCTSRSTANYESQGHRGDRSPPGGDKGRRDRRRRSQQQRGTGRYKKSNSGNDSNSIRSSGGGYDGRYSKRKDDVDDGDGHHYYGRGGPTGDEVYDDGDVYPGAVFTRYRGGGGSDERDSHIQSGQFPHQYHREHSQGPQGKYRRRERGGGRSRRPPPHYRPNEAKTASIEYVENMTALGKNGQWFKAKCAYEAATGGGAEMSMYMFNATVSALAKSGRWSEGLAVMEDMKKAGHSPDVYTYNSIIQACAKGGEGERALALFDDMRFRGVMADAFTYNHLVTACKDGSWERALDLVRQLDEAHLEVSSVTFNGVIVACGNGGQLNKALGVLQEMRQRGVMLTEGTFAAAISACGKAGQWERAISLLDEMPKDDLVPNSYCYNAAIQACLSVDRWQEAVEVMRTALADPDSVDRINFKQTLVACAAAGEVSVAHQLIEELHEAGRLIPKSTLKYVEFAEQVFLKHGPQSAADRCRKFSSLASSQSTVSSGSGSDVAAVTWHDEDSVKKNRGRANGAEFSMSAIESQFHRHGEKETEEEGEVSISEEGVTVTDGDAFGSAASTATGAAGPAGVEHVTGDVLDEHASVLTEMQPALLQDISPLSPFAGAAAAAVVRSPMEEEIFARQPSPCSTISMTTAAPAVDEDGFAENTPPSSTDVTAAAARALSLPSERAVMLADSSSTPLGRENERASPIVTGRELPTLHDIKGSAEEQNKLRGNTCSSDSGAGTNQAPKDTDTDDKDRLKAAASASPAAADNAGKSNGKKKKRAPLVWEPPYSSRKFVLCVKELSNRGDGRDAVKLLRTAMKSPEVKVTMVMYEAGVMSAARQGLVEEAMKIMSWIRESKLKPSSMCLVWAIRACGKASEVNVPLALALLRQMDPPDAWGYSATLSACANGGQWETGLSLLEEMPSAGLRANVHCYSAAIAALAKARPAQSRKALDLLEKMRNNGVEPNNVTYDAVIRACVFGGDLQAAKALYREMIEGGFEPLDDLKRRVGPMRALSERKITEV